MGKDSDRLVRLKKQLRQAKAKLRASEAKRHTRRAILVGTMILRKVECGELSGTEFRIWLDAEISSPSDRALFDLDTAAVALTLESPPEDSTIVADAMPLTGDGPINRPDEIVSKTLAKAALPRAAVALTLDPPSEVSTVADAMVPSTCPIKALVYPIITASDYSRQDPPIALERASKAQALAALRRAGYRIMTAGGSHDENTITAEALRNGRGDQPAVTEQERKLGHQLPDDAEIICYLVTVHPTALLRKALLRAAR